MRQQLTAYINTAIFGIIVAVAALTPLIFSNLTTEFFETPKLILLVVSVLVLLTLWAVSWVIEGKVVITRTPLDLPLLLVFAIVLLSTFFSSTWQVAVFGNLPSVHGSAFSWVAYILFYFIVTSNLKSLFQIKILIYALLASTVLTSLISIVSFFGVYLPFSFAQIQSFNPAGSSFSANFLSVLLLPVLLSSILKPNRVIPQIVALVLTVIFAIALALTGSKAIWFGVIFVLLVTILASKRQQLLKALPLLVLPVAIALVLVVLTIVPIGKMNPLYNQKQSFPTEIQLSWANSWKVAASAFADKPFLGTGPETFLFNYTQYKPIEMNQSKYWTLRFDTAFNEFFHFLGTMGGLGLMALLFLVVMVINFARKGCEDRKVCFLFEGLPAPFQTFPSSMPGRILLLILLLSLLRAYESHRVQ
jgi:O-antigen ligase